MRGPLPAPRRRLWPMFVPLALAGRAGGRSGPGCGSTPPAAAETALAGWRAREAKSGRIYECGSETDRRLPVPHRGALHQSERRAARQAHAARAQGRRPRGAGADLSADAADRRVHGPDDDRRAGAAAGLRRELDARPVEHARHAARAASAASLVFDDPIVQRAGQRRARRCSMPSVSSCTAAWWKARPTTIR